MIHLSKDVQGHFYMANNSTLLKEIIETTTNGETCDNYRLELNYWLVVHLIVLICRFNGILIKILAKIPFAKSERLPAKPIRIHKEPKRGNLKKEK